MPSTNGRRTWTVLSALACAALLTACGATAPAEPLVVTRVQAACITVPDQLFDCRSRKPQPPDPASARESDVARYIERLDAALDACATDAEAARDILADRRCKGDTP